MSKQSFEREEVIDILFQVVNRISDTRVLFGEIINGHVPKAVEELNEVVATTESSTNVIMTACENAQEKLSKGVAPDEISKNLNEIIEACTFQDITGQRLNRVRKSLNDIHMRLTELLLVLDGRFMDAAALKEQRLAIASGASPLMAGPQLPGQGVSQEEIDRMLDQF